MADQLELQRRGGARTVLVALGGELDLASAPQLEQELRDIATTRPGRILLDLRQLAFMDCAGLSVLIRAQEAADANSHELALANLPTQVRRLLALTGLSDCFTVESDL